MGSVTMSFSSLAAALALPLNFPYRDLIFFTSFAVVLATLVIQGMTLRPLLIGLGVRDDGTVERQARLARVEAVRAALEAVAACAGGDQTVRPLQQSGMPALSFGREVV